MKNRQTKKSQKKCGPLFWLFTTTATLLGLLCGFVILVWYSPSAYQPQVPKNPEQISLYLTHELGPAFVNQVQLNKPFDLVIEQKGLNDIISRQLWPQELGELSLADPVVYFLDDTIVLMGTLRYKEVSSVLSITALPEMNVQGQICMNIESIRLGMLPVTSFAAALVKSTIAENQDIFEGQEDLQNIVQALVNNEYFDPSFWFFDYRVRVTKFSLNTGVLKITLAPKIYTQT